MRAARSRARYLGRCNPHRAGVAVVWPRTPYIWRGWLSLASSPKGPFCRLASVRPQRWGRRGATLAGTAPTPAAPAASCGAALAVPWSWQRQLASRPADCLLAAAAPGPGWPPPRWLGGGPPPRAPWRPASDSSLARSLARSPNDQYASNPFRGSRANRKTFYTHTTALSKGPTSTLPHTI